MNPLPCPFCGEAPRLSRRQDEDLTTHNIVWWDRVYCINCDVGFEWPEHHEVTAMIQWNTRAEPVAVLSAEVVANLAIEISDNLNLNNQLLRKLQDGLKR